ncbi:carboxy terminal-processing peptidase [Psychroserpens sp. Hel_I_66]|uniref:carboxy terminal-processing peptidase n=1 Tax=Psychroserpens sp. Hel_I_66 TaxID=1250004 RepID=UPI00064762B6|nr:carboxy terminal-processing peptidase [Psychroserpens sp. Hel_I_66]
MPKYPSIFCAIFFTVLCGYSQTENLFCDQVKALKNVIKLHHYQPKTVNDSLSTHVFDLFIESLDEDRRLFSQSNIDTFETDRYQLDDYLTNENCEFIEKYATALSQRIELSKTIISNLQAEDFNYTGKDTLRFKPESRFSYFKDDDAVKNYWSKRLRYDILYTLVENDSVLGHIESDFITLEKNLKPKLIQKELCKLEELQNKLGSLDQFVKEAFLNALLHYHDPNSIYFNATEKEIFENALSNNQFSFGIITAKNDDGDIVIAHIAPGSAAYNDGNFEVNDVIKSLTANSETLETYCVSNQDVLAFTSDQKHNTIAFKIKKTDGSLKTIELTKTKTKIEENTVSGFIIENKAKVGYISIPSFYSDFESPNGLGLANDVAKELYKLQKENIEGLILDLRFNGGGSMKEATDLSGMFINRGPLSILKYNSGETFTVKDLNRGSLFNKPLIILVNNYSASASEFFAASMQDYNRAVVVGAATHGKASAQVILPLDENETLGYSKITVEKFYRVTGKSHQAEGVIPDIVLPNLYEGFRTQEQFSEFALTNDTISGIKKYPKLKKLPLEKLKKLSKSRVNNESTFESIKLLNKLILKNYFELDTSYLLTLNNVHSEMLNYRSQWNKINKPIDSYNSNLMVKNSAYTKEVVSYDEDQKLINQNTLKDIKNDIYIEEAYAILQDLLNLIPLK